MGTALRRLAGAGLALMWLATCAQAQTVRGQLTDSVSRSPLPAAFLTLLDQQGHERARTITNSSGEFTLTAPVAGTYRLRSKRIGFRPYVSDPLVLNAGATVAFNAAIDPIPVPLQQIVVAGDRQCDVEAGASVAALWEEVKEALAAVAWWSRAPGYWYDLSHFERDVFSGSDREGFDSTWSSSGFFDVPFRSVPAEDLERDGFVLEDQDGWTYREPDADVLLSASFLRTHCFETKVGDGDTEGAGLGGLVGLAFSPARGRRLPDITGTLWVDRKSAELRHLEFRYTRLPLGLNAPKAGGRVEFIRVPTGAWMVRDWIIRMPLAELVQAPNGVTTFRRVIGYRERGGSTQQIKTTGGTIVYSSRDTARAIATAAPAPPRAPPPPVPSVAVTSVPAPADAPAAPVLPPPPVEQARPASSPSRSRDVLTRDEFETSAASDAYGVVQQYRSLWLRSRGPTSFEDPSAGLVKLYVNGISWGNVERLREIPQRDVLEIRYRNGQEATLRYGANHAGGVIEVRTR